MDDSGVLSRSLEEGSRSKVRLHTHKDNVVIRITGGIGLNLCLFRSQSRLVELALQATDIEEVIILFPSIINKKRAWY